MSNIEPANLAELQTICKHYSASGFFGHMSPEQALVIAMAGRDLGFSYTQALRAFHVLKGKPTLSADGMVAAVLARGICEYFRPVEVTETSATWETRRAGNEPVRYTFTMIDAERAGIVSDMYRKHPKRMLSARCKAYLARDVYPEVLMGLITDDEAHEIERRNVVLQPTLQPTLQPSPVIVAQVQASGFDDDTPARNILAEADACDSLDALARLWKETTQLRGALNEVEADAVKAYFTARKAELNAAGSKGGAT